MSIPALDRGLQILEYLISTAHPCKYSEIKKCLPGISDSSLNRLLKSLMDSSHIGKDENGLYYLNRKVLSWTTVLTRHADFEAVINDCVFRLCHLVEESTGFAMFINDHIEIVKSRSYPDSISIIEEKGILHFESDHAASLAIMEGLSQSQIDEALRSKYSKIKTYEELQEGFFTFRKGNCFADNSRTRIGVSRLAVKVESEDRLGALFLCLPTSRLKQRIDELSTSLLQNKQELEHKLKVLGT